MFPCFLKRSSASAHPDVHYIWPWLVTFSLLQLFGDWKRYRNLVCWNSVSAPRPSYLAEEWHHSHSDVECSDLHNELKLLDCYYTAITAWNFRWSVCSLTHWADFCKFDSLYYTAFSRSLECPSCKKWHGVLATSILDILQAVNKTEGQEKKRGLENFWLTHWEMECQWQSVSSC